ncbi:hypothetical protein PPN31114_03974 [Pandoraea pneumonica]|uniref:Uncharacterized protein n=1 Tax=Pandoraea pneumonica TaxID=2508299 RepID=A0A5E4XME4_9BURK|nr:hypothetical protein PPN31114_03974 [Pandoraea pneumonica]
MGASPNWFLYSGYVPADAARLLSFGSIARAICLSNRTEASAHAQHGPVVKWLRWRAAERKLPN